jgi:hypothetical protein
MTSADHPHVGEVLPGFSYVLTQQMFDDYRDTVQNPTAVYPIVAARHPAHCFYSRYNGRFRVPNAGYECEYYNPPLPDRRIDVAGRLVDLYDRRGKTYVVVEAVATDELGRLIEVSRLVGLLRKSGSPAFEPVVRKLQGDKQGDHA